MRTRVPTETALCIGITALLYLAFVLIRLGIHGFDPSLFIVAGDTYCDHATLPAPVTLQAHSAGYDGQFYFRLALAPFSTQPVDHGIHFDQPVYRSQRILYPFAVWLFSWGQPRVALWMMIAVNLLALCLLAWIGAAHAREFNLRPLWGLAFPLYPGLMLSLARDLTEIFAVTCLALAMLAIRRGKSTQAICALTLAAMSRETTLLACAGLCMAWIAARLTRTKQSNTPPAIIWILPVIVYSIWLANVWLRWGAGFSLDHHNFTLPLSGLASFIKSLWPPPSGRELILCLEVAYLIAFATTAAIALRTSRALTWEKCIFAIYALIPLAASRAIWTEDWSFLRVLAEFHCAGTIVILSSANQRACRAIFAGMALLWILLFFHTTQLSALILKGHAAP